MVDRVDAIVGELSRRYPNRPEFFARLHPHVQRILEPETPTESRTRLLEMVAEICERDAEIERRCARMRDSVQAISDRLRRIAAALI